jgi:hypothetical protein
MKTHYKTGDSDKLIEMECKSDIMWRCRLTSKTQIKFENNWLKNMKLDIYNVTHEFKSQI